MMQPGAIPEGQKRMDPATGRVAVYQQGQWVMQPAGPPVDASQRGRLSLGLGPMVQAQQTMAGAERQGNPLQKDWGASVLSGVADATVFGQKPLHGLDDIAKAWGGQDYQSYMQAAKTFESQLMPIMSGAAVSPSEAQRQIKAALPELGDSPETLAQKAQTRQMMLNGAAKSMNSPMPYPQTPTYGVNSMELPQSQGQGGGQPVRVNSPEEAARLPPGTKFITPDGRTLTRH